MNSQRMIWLTSVAAVVSAVVSVATVCVVVPHVIRDRSVDDVVSKHQPSSAAPLAKSAFTTTSAERQAAFDDAQDLEAARAIKEKLAINVFSSTLLDGIGLDEAEPKPNAATPAQTPHDVAAEALSTTAEQLEASGQHEAARLVRAAIAELSDNERAAGVQPDLLQR